MWPLCRSRGMHGMKSSDNCIFSITMQIASQHLPWHYVNRPLSAMWHSVYWLTLVMWRLVHWITLVMWHLVHWLTFVMWHLVHWLTLVMWHLIYRPALATISYLIRVWPVSLLTMFHAKRTPIDSFYLLFLLFTHSI